MKSRLLIFLVVTSILFYGCKITSNTAAVTIEDNFKNEYGDVMIMAHRANLIDSLPENSLEAVLACIEHKIDIVEIDLQVTKDGVLILMHDDRLDRMTNGKGKVQDKTWEEIQQLNLRKSSFGEVTTYKIPSFEDLLYAAKGKIMINVDKAFWYMHSVSAIADTVGVSNQIILKSYDSREEVEKSLKYGMSAYFMPIFLERGTGNLENIQAFIYPEDNKYPEAVELIFESMEDSIASQAFLKILKEKGIRPMVNSLSDGLCGGHGDTKNAKENWKFLMDHGFSIIQTDKGLELQQFLDSLSTSVR